MWLFRKKKPEVDKEWEALCKRYKAAEAFAKKGDSILYLGVKMLVVGHHNWNRYGYNTPSIRVEWMDKNNCLHEGSISDCDFCLCEVIHANKAGHEIIDSF